MTITLIIGQLLGLEKPTLCLTCEHLIAGRCKRAMRFHEREPKLSGKATPEEESDLWMWGTQRNDDCACYDKAKS